ncbi:MAG TPA: prephenate dehydratase domain-containing protein [Sandaracinaceae bacterium LLY-WYZ-13_1]|nr:prephenate dehydratase domain-containing protein [Sandaracinaceae bacterium LLY-WYZ-13_1]
MVDEEELAKIREALDAADAALVAALDDRAKAIERFVALRERHPEAYHSLPSAAEVVERALERVKAFPREPLETALREVLGACARMVAPVEVAVLGPEAGFAQVAAQHHFGSSAEIHAQETVGEVFEDVERNRVSYGVVPFETSSDGALAATVDELARSESRICAEITIPNTYDLVSKTGNAADVEKIYATPNAAAACEANLQDDFPRATILDVKSGRIGAELAKEDHGAAAIVAGWSEDDPDGLRLVKDRIEDRTGVETRFVVIGHERPPRTGTDRTILALAVGDEPGSLHKALQPFADRGINLTRIESRPARGQSWRYLFIVELDGHVTDRSVLTAVDEVRGASRHVKILGSFPRPV